MSSDFTAITTRFGVLEARPEGTLRLTSPLAGFEGLTLFTLLRLPDFAPLIWMQSLEEAGLAFPLLEPDAYFPDYSQTICSHLSREATILCLVSRQAGRLGLNLLAPLLIDAMNGTAEQVIVPDPGLDVFHACENQIPC
ncbi:flagellar assembly protein FliW [bacterium]|nr:flagellar assembly protein FliW [bacterium]